MFDDIRIPIEGGLDFPLPRLLGIRQKFEVKTLHDVGKELSAQWQREAVRSKIKPSMNVAIAVGSRGIAGLQRIVRTVVSEIKSMGAHPFVVPAMGSHGGATAAGQLAVLAEYGITEADIGAPIRSSMNTVLVGEAAGVPLFCDEFAYASDAIILINRVKPHTDFKGKYESGLLKMLIIGLGKHKGATAMHTLGFDRFHDTIPEAGKLLLERLPIAAGVAVLENAYDETAEIEVLTQEEIFAAEPLLLERAKRYMPKLPFADIDVLVIDEIGKEISGSGMDPNITGRAGPGMSERFNGPSIQKIMVRDLTGKTHGNASGIGLADIITAKLFRKIDFAFTYANCITSTALYGAKIPVVLQSDREALAVAVKTCNRVTPDKAKIVWIKNTLELERVYVSETYMEEISARPDLDIVAGPVPLAFDDQGNLLPF